MRIAALAAALSVALAGAAAAQPDPDAMIARLEQSQAAAAAAAQRTGDDALTCEALQAEVTTLMTSPEMAAFNAQNAAFAARYQDQMAGARGQMAAGMAMGMGMGLASAFIPGLGMAQSLAMRAQAAGMQRQATENQNAMIEQAGNTEAAMPTLMRAQRVVELAQAKQCAFLQDGSVPQQ